MDIQYKPTKAKKEKPVKAPKTHKVEKAMSFGSVKTVKIDKPKKEKPVKAPKPVKSEKPKAFKPGKVESVAEVKSFSKTCKPMNPTVRTAILCALAALVCVAALVLFINTDADDETPAVKPETLSISTLPLKTDYFVGEAAAFSDLMLEVKLSNGVCVPLRGSDCEIIGFDSSASANNQTITVKYKELTATFAVVIKEGQSSSANSGKYTQLSFKKLPDKLTYKVGEWIDPTGGILLVHYEDGTTRELELSIDYMYGYNGDVPGQQTITVKYVERGYYAETSYTITVTE